MNTKVNKECGVCSDSHTFVPRVEGNHYLGSTMIPTSWQTIVKSNVFKENLVCFSFNCSSELGVSAWYSLGEYQKRQTIKIRGKGRKDYKLSPTQLKTKNRHHKNL